MNANSLSRTVSLVALMAMALPAQVARQREAVPLKPWPTPLFWQPTQAENQATAAQRNALGDAAAAEAPAASATNALVFIGITPCRLVDTRTGTGFTGAFGPPRLAGGASRTFPIQSSTTCAIPSIAQAYSFNVTVVPPGPLGFITAYPTGQPLPLAATLNSLQGFIVGNAAIVPAGTAGSVDVYASEPTDLVIDINGYYVPQTLGSLTLPPGTANAPGLSFTGDPGTGIFSSGMGILNLAAGGKSGVTLNSTGDLTVAGGIHASGPISSGSSITIDGTTNSITVDSLPVKSGSKINELYIGGDNQGLGGFPVIPFDKIQVGIGTRSIVQKLTIFDPTAPGIGLYANVGGGELAVATCFTCYSNVATPGDLILRTPGGTAKDLILTSRNSNAGGIRFTTGFANNVCPGCESEKMRILQNGFVGIGTTPPGSNPYVPPDPLFAVGLSITSPFYPFQVNHVGDLTRINNVQYSWPTALGIVGDVLKISAASGNLVWGSGGSGGGNVSSSSTCAANFLTKWLAGPNTVGCSSITELATGTFNVGIGPGTTNPTRQFEVNGDINIPATGTGHHYQIQGGTVLSVDGSSNLFVGLNVGPSNTGHDNTFLGQNAGASNGTGKANTFTGTSVGSSNTTGSDNTFSGWAAGSANIGGSDNTFSGYEAGINNVSGSQNTFLGAFSGIVHGTGDGNTFVGYDTANGHKTGQFNTFLGFAAGNNNVSGDNDIYIGNLGCAGTCSESNTIRIGTQGTQSKTFIAGIFGNQVLGAVNVFIDASGQLVTSNSSRRFKEDIQDMSQASSGLLRLRPVTYRYKQPYADGSKPIDYGLIAEEVAEVYPDLVVKNAEGQVQTVQYHKLVPMLLNEVQKQAQAIQLQQEQNRKLEARLAALETLLSSKQSTAVSASFTTHD